MAVQDVWRECCDWLARINLIRQDHLLKSPNSTLKDLCVFLRDGVMICKILHILDEDSIDLRTINQRPQNAQFLCVKNIGIFLQTCTRKFNLNRTDLFEPLMLFELSDIGRVLTTLSKLSKCPKAQRHQIKGFPADDDSREEDDVYSVLPKNIFNGPEDVEDTYKKQTDAYSFTEEIYTELRLAPQHPEQWGYEDELYESPDDLDISYWHDDDHIYEDPDSEAVQNRPREKRDLCLQEIMDTETNYVEALEMIINQFYSKLNDCIGEESCKKIFSTIPKMVKTHKRLLQGLNKAQSSAVHSVSQVFLDNQEELLIYGEYCANLSIAQQELEDLMNNNDLAKSKINDCQNLVREGKHQLREYLVVPLQRILKYHLLLRELIKYTTETHNDYENLKRAHEAMLDLANYINEVKRDSEMQQIIKDLQSSIMDMPADMSNMEDLGKLRHDGDIKIECHPNPIKKRYVFVFDKVMIICKKTKRLSLLFANNNPNRWSLGDSTTEDEKYVYKDCVRLNNCKVDNNVVGITRKQNSFYLVLGEKEAAYTIITNDSDEKTKWVKSITEAIEFLNPQENQTLNHVFVITTFPKPSTRCEKCSKLLKGCIFQGYQCTDCKMIVDRKCLGEVTRCPGCPPRPLTPPSRPPFPSIPSFQVGLSGMPLPQSYPAQIYAECQSILKDFPWWVDKMVRNDAALYLLRSEEGTFLLRWSERHQQLVLSLRRKGEVKHMKVHYVEESNTFCLSGARYFATIVDLIAFYRFSQLSECFDGLDCVLRRPIYDTAMVQFAYEGTGPNHLSLQEGEQVIILSREGENRGWWKGRIGTRVGYFPKEYVTTESDPVQNW